MKRYRVLHSVDLPELANLIPMQKYLIYFCFNRTYGHYTIATLEVAHGKWAITTPWGQTTSPNSVQLISSITEHNYLVRGNLDFGSTDATDTHWDHLTGGQ